MMFAIIHVHPGITALAFFQGTQLSLFESFLTRAISGINSTSITSGMQNVAYVVLLIGFLWQVYQASLHGGDVRGLGVSLIKYVATAVVVMNYSAIFTTVNQGFVNAGNWIGNATGVGNLLDNWKNDISTQYSHDGAQQMWGLVTGSMAGLIDGLLILVAYILYPFVIAIFGFFYIFYGSVLYIFGPIVIALMPLGATNRLAKAYVENVFIWNAWPILYGGFGALLSAVQMGQVGQMLSQNNFLGGLGNLEGSFLIGAASIIYSLAIAVIPFIAKRIVSGEVGATAGTLLGAAATALTAGIAATEGVAAGITSSAGEAASGGGKAASGSSSAAGTSRAGMGSNQPAAAQRAQPSNPANQHANIKDHAASTPSDSAPPTRGEAVADSIRGGLESAVDPTPRASESEGNVPSSGAESSTTAAGDTSTGRLSHRVTASPQGSSPTSNPSSRRSSGPTPGLTRPHGLATWGAYHGARLATQGIIGGARAAGEVINGAAGGVGNPVRAASKMGAKAGQIAGTATNAAEKTATTVAKVANAATHPRETVGAGVQAVSSAASAAVANTASTIRQSVKAVSSNFSEAYEKTHSGKTPTNNESA